MPLVARGRLKGTLNIYRAGYQEFTEDEFRLVVRFADAAALAIDNAHIRAALEHQAQTDPLTGLWNHRAFHERLRQELLVASTDQTPVALVMLDLDDFKRVNDVYSHATGDHVLSEVASILLAIVRTSDTVCRIGGEEFAIIVPASGLPDAFRLAERIQEQVAVTPFGPVGPVSLSIGIASGPTHAANPRELVACAEVAMMTAKARGKGKIVVFQEDSPERPGDGSVDRGAEFRSIAHLKMLHGVSTKLSRLNDVAEIGATIADELRLLIDYHNCRVFVREGDDLRPIAFRGDLSASGSAMDLLATRVGDGITGHVAATGEPFLTGDAAHCDDRRPDPGHRRDRGVAPRRPVPVRPDRGRRDRRLEARARPVRRRRPPAPRGARGPRLGRARERAPLRGAAARGREREGAARADARALRRDGPRRRARARW